MTDYGTIIVLVAASEQLRKEHMPSGPRYFFETIVAADALPFGFGELGFPLGTDLLIFNRQEPLDFIDFSNGFGGDLLSARDTIRFLPDLDHPRLRQQFNILPRILPNQAHMARHNYRRSGKRNK